MPSIAHLLIDLHKPCYASRLIICLWVSGVRRITLHPAGFMILWLIILSYFFVVLKKRWTVEESPIIV